MNPHARNRFCRHVIAFAALLAGLGVGGCYSRVINASGIGTETIEVQKPLRSDTALDRAVFPENGSDK